MEQSRWKSPVFWSSMIVAVVGVLATFGVISPDIATKITGAVATILAVLVGNFNNSTNPNGWGANKTEE